MYLTFIISLRYILEIQARISVLKSMLSYDLLPSRKTNKTLIGHGNHVHIGNHAFLSMKLQREANMSFSKPSSVTCILILHHTHSCPFFMCVRVHVSGSLILRCCRNPQPSRSSSWPRTPSMWRPVWQSSSRQLRPWRVRPHAHTADAHGHTLFHSTHKQKLALTTFSYPWPHSDWGRDCVAHLTVHIFSEC